MNELLLFVELAQIENTDHRLDKLSEMTVDNPALRARLEELLEAHARASNFLPTSHHPGGGDPPTSIMPEAEKTGTTIGPYKLLQEIGEGGMGTVFMAEQSKPVQRRVALKIIKAGMDTRQVIARFEAERQALALMDHPNIAKVLDAGATVTGRPYFVMELVKGTPLTKYCDDKQLPLRERLELFIQVCKAIQHAHQKGIIHRDIKPTNVLVAQYDGKPVPKVIDFGVAKATAQKLTEKTMFTEFGMVIGTVEYMSPEQAEVNQLDIDTRSDVYSLGVMLYELLTGSTPLESKKLRAAAHAEMLRMIREDEPSRPSIKLSTSAALPSIAASRGTDPGKLKKFVAGELDWIVMKTLEKERARRYGSAMEFAEDVQRYLNDEAVKACPPSNWYRLRKSLRRNGRSLAIGGAVAIAILVGAMSIGGSALYLAAADAARTAQARDSLHASLKDIEAFVSTKNWLEAKAALVQLRKSTAFPFADQVQRDRTESLMREMEMVLRLDDIRLEMASVENESFDISSGHTLFKAAFQDFGINLSDRNVDTAQIAKQLKDSPIAPELVDALHDWVRVFDARKSHEALSIDQLIEFATQLDSDPWRIKLRAVAFPAADESTLQMMLAEFPPERWRPSDALLLKKASNTREGIQLVLRRAQQAKPGDFWINEELGVLLSSGAEAEQHESVGFLRSALAIRPMSVRAQFNLANVLHQLNQDSEVISLMRRASKLHPSHSGARTLLADALSGIGNIKEAETTYREAIAINSRRIAPHVNLGKLLYEHSRHHEALAEFRIASELAPTHSVVLNNLGNALRRTGALEEAEQAFRDAINSDPQEPGPHNGLGGLLCDEKGAYAEAISEFAQAIHLDPKEELYHKNMVICLANMGSTYSEIFLSLIQENGPFWESTLRNTAIEFAKPNLFDGLGTIIVKNLAEDCASTPRLTHYLLNPDFLSYLAAIDDAEIKGESVMLLPGSLRPSKMSKSSEAKRNLRFESLESRRTFDAAFGSVIGIGNGESSSAAFGVDTDSAGNRYVTGYFSGQVDFDEKAIYSGDVDILMAQGNTDAYVAKYAPDDSLLWVRRMGGAFVKEGAAITDRGFKIDAKSSSGVYVTGTFQGPSDFGSIVLNSGLGRDGFLAKLDSNGDVNWVKAIDIEDMDTPAGLGVDASGNAVVLRAHFNTTGFDIFKYEPSGNLAWSKTWENNSLPETNLTVDSLGAIYVAGAFDGTVDFDPGPGTKNVTATGVTAWSAFAMKLTSQGNLSWVSPFLGGLSSAQGIQVDPTGNVIVGGSYNNSPGKIDFNPGAGTAFLGNLGANGPFIAKLNSAGAYVWAKSLDSETQLGGGVIRQIDIDSTGNIYAIGNFTGTIDLNPAAAIANRSSQGGQDVFAAKYSSSGAYQWGDSFGGTGSDWAYGIAVDAQNNIHLAGYFQFTVDFDAGPGDSSLTTNGTTNKGFLKKLRQI